MVNSFYHKIISSHINTRVGWKSTFSFLLCIGKTKCAIGSFSHGIQRCNKYA